MKIIIEDRDIIEAIERAQYETHNRKYLIDYMTENNIDINFKYYERKYLNALNNYNKKKREFERKYVPSKCNWSLDFDTGELTID